MDLGQIFEEQYPTFLRYACSLVKDEAAAKDLVMDVFERMIVRNKQLPRDIDMRAYITVSIRNRFLDVHTRRQGAGPVEVNDEQVPDEIAHRQVYADVNLDEIIEKLERLGEKCKSILSLTGLGYSYREISAAEDVPIGTVMSRMARCRERFLDLYREEHK